MATKNRSRKNDNLNRIDALCRHIGTRIKAARRSTGYTQEEFADRLDLSANFIAHLERGSRKPSLDTLAVMSDLLGMPINYFFTAGPDPAGAKGESPLLRRAMRMIRDARPENARLVVKMLEAMPEK